MRPSIIHRLPGPCSGPRLESARLASSRVQRAFAATVESAVNLRCYVRALRWQSAIAVFGGLTVLAAIVGFWTLQTHLAAADRPDPIAASQVVAATGPARVTDGSIPAMTSEDAVFSTDPLKSAGIKRDRPVDLSRSAPPEWSLRTPASLMTTAHSLGVPHSRAPATPQTGQAILSQLCVAQR